MDTYTVKVVGGFNDAGFNVAMDFHTWIHANISGYIRGTTLSFNVAMDFHTWIPKSIASMALVMAVLQCCHGFSYMDTNACGPPSFPVVMLQCCHGFSYMDTYLMEVIMWL